MDNFEIDTFGEDDHDTDVNFQFGKQGRGYQGETRFDRRSKGRSRERNREDRRERDYW